MGELIVFGIVIGVSMAISITIVGFIITYIMMQPRCFGWLMNWYSKSFTAIISEEISDD